MIVTVFCFGLVAGCCLFFILAWLGAKDEKMPAVPVAPLWTKQDMENWRRFLDSPTGQKFLARIHAVEYVNAVAAGADKVSPGNAACRSGGFTDCIKTIKAWSFSCASHEQEAPATESEEGDPMLSELRDYQARVSP